VNYILTTPENRELVASFTVHGEPISKSRARFTKRGSKMVSYTPQKTMDGEKAMAAAFLAVAKARGVDEDATYAVHAHFINGTRQRRDVDNMVKLILDGLNDVAWPDDNQVTEIAARKSWATKAEARTEVTVYRIGEMGRPSQACLQCGELFRSYASTNKGPSAKKYCSLDCGNLYRAALRARTCRHCSNEFQADGELHEVGFCSKECAYDSRRADVECTNCGVTFNKQRCHVRAVNYCSTECRAAKQKERKSNYYPGKCGLCGGGTTRKEYKRCQPCKTKQEGVTGRPARKRKIVEAKTATYEYLVRDHEGGHAVHTTFDSRAEALAFMNEERGVEIVDGMFLADGYWVDMVVFE